MTNLLEALFLNAVVASLLAAMVRMFCLVPAVRRVPLLRQALWSFVLLKLVTPPLISWPVLPVNSLPTQSRLDRSGDETRVAISPSHRPQTARSAIGPSEAPSPRIAWQGVVLCIISIGAGSVLACSVRQVRSVQRALRWAREDDPRLNALAQSCAAAIGVAPPNVAVVSASVAPLLWIDRGRPLIVVPRRLADSLSDAQLSCILQHEIAHYVRRDHWINAASVLVTALFWWLPTAWWARRELRTAQELCCDALVIHRWGASRRVYATTIWQTLESLHIERPLLPALASGFGGKSSAVRRMEMIANPRVRYVWSWWHLSLVLPALLALPCLPVRGEADGRLSRAFVADPESDEQEARDDDARDSEGATDDREDKEAADDDQDGDDKEGESADDDDDEAEHDTPMKFEDLPEAVQKTLKRESAGGEIEELEKEVKGDRVIYCADVEYETDEGELLYDIEIAENGTLLFKILDDEGDDAPDDDGEGNEKPK